MASTLKTLNSSIHLKMSVSKLNQLKFWSTVENLLSKPKALLIAIFFGFLALISMLVLLHLKFGNLSYHSLELDYVLFHACDLIYNLWLQGLFGFLNNLNVRVIGSHELCQLFFYVSELAEVFLFFFFSRAQEFSVFVHYDTLLQAMK